MNTLATVPTRGGDLLSVRLHYVDGVEVSSPPENWAELRADGLDWFEVETDTGTTRFKGKSLYWLYERDGVWYAGGCGIGYDATAGGTIAELVVGGKEDVNVRTSVPDLYHDEVKLGWWWPGTESVVDG